MKLQFSLSSKGRIAVAVGAAFASASALAADKTILYGGGATLPAVAYLGISANASDGQAYPTGGSNPRLAALGPGPAGTANSFMSTATTLDTTSLFGATTDIFANLGGSSGRVPPIVSYCQSGSGGGKKILVGSSGFAASNATCGLFSDSAAVTGFSAASDLSTFTPPPAAPGVHPDFVGSDAPLSQGEYTLYITNYGSTTIEPVQFPSIAGSIALGYNTSASTFGGALTDKDICLIFSKQVTLWNDSRLSHPGTVSASINVVVRSDGSGTSFSFANHLSAVCTTANLGTSHGFFKVDQTWSNVISTLIPNPGIAAYDAKSGNPGVANEVLAVTNSLGYGETANFQAGFPTIKAATVNGLSPVANFPSVITFVNLALPDQGITGTSATTGAAVLGALTPAPTHPNCINIADPASYSTPPAGVYPIMAVTNLLGNYAGNGTDNDVYAIRAILTSPYDSQILGEQSLIGAGKGFAVLSLSDAGGFALSSTAVTNTIDKCINN